MHTMLVLVFTLYIVQLEKEVKFLSILHAISGGVGSSATPEVAEKWRSNLRYSAPFGSTYSGSRHSIPVVALVQTRRFFKPFVSLLGVT